jgi:hypothetical protein
MKVRCEGCGDGLGGVEPAATVAFSREMGWIAEKI